MLKETKYNDTKLLGNVVVLLKDDATFVEYKVPPQINNAILTMDLSNYIKRW
jgi:hemolysin-activating ACP:hemolysin acyltransferase